MFCPSCGTKNNYYHRYCFYCGASLNANDQEDADITEFKTKTEREDGEYQYRYSSPEKTHDDEFGIPSFLQRNKGAVPEDNPSQDNAKTYDKNADTMKEKKTFGEEVPEDKPVREESDFIFNSNFDDFPDTIDDEDYFDISSQIPLRRYQKDNEEGDGGLKTLVTVCLSVVMAALIFFVGYVVYDQIFNDTKSTQVTPGPKNKLDFSYDVEATELNGEPARRIFIFTAYGEQVKILGQVLPVVNGKAEIVIRDTELFAMETSSSGQQEVDIALSIFVFADGYDSLEGKVELNIPTPYAPLRVIQPVNNEALVDSSKYNLVLEVTPGSTVIVDDNDYSHLVDGKGQVTIQLSVPGEPENRYSIKVSTKGYADNLQEVVLKRTQMEFPLAIDQSIPIKTTEEWVEITGITDPGAVLSSNLEFQSQPVIDPETGKFSVFVKAPRYGHIPFVLTASLTGKQDSVLNAVIDRSITEAEYTSTAWAYDYEQMITHPNLHRGQHYAFKGIIKEVLISGDKNIFIVNIAAEDAAEQLIHVEYWGTFTFKQGESLRIFGNHWGSENNLPRILARYLYR